jgi:secreted trypsin-like serine protease
MNLKSAVGFLALVCACGPATSSTVDDAVDSAENEIVGGVISTIEAVPWQVAVMTPRFQQYCGGSIISANWIVTANHCTVSVGDKIGAGSAKLSTIRTTGQVRTVAQVISFAGFQGPETGRDIALLRLDTPLNLDGVKTKAIAYAKAGDTSLYAAGTLATVSGWGTLSSGGSSPNTVRRVDVRVSTDAAVRSAYGNVSSDQFGAASPGKDSCQGDSGGPIIVRSGNTPILTGVVSYGNGCALAGFPGMYSKVASFSNFIATNTGVQ